MDLESPLKQPSSIDKIIKRFDLYCCWLYNAFDINLVTLTINIDARIRSIVSVFQKMTLLNLHALPT